MLLAALISGPKPVARPLVAVARPASAVKAGSVEVRKPETAESRTALDRLLNGFPIAAAVPVAIKPEFSNGPAAALSVKF